MKGEIDSLYRYPVKGFSPERLDHADLTEGGYFPDDRLYAVENGPSGFDPAAPAHISKSKFTVLAQIPEVARIRTRYESGVFHAKREGRGGVSADLTREAGRVALAAWLEGAIDPEQLRGPLRLVHAPGHRFTDHPEGYVSVLNLASVEALAQRMAAPLDPLRFRANVQVSGWPPWIENQWTEGTKLVLGGVSTTVFKPIVRCAATHVNPTSGVRDADILEALYRLEGHLFCGLYLRVRSGGRLARGDTVEAHV
jgi:uncharacterized protein YcbX